MDRQNEIATPQGTGTPKRFTVQPYFSTETDFARHVLESMLSSTRCEEIIGTFQRGNTVWEDLDKATENYNVR